MIIAVVHICSRYRIHEMKFPLHNAANCWVNVQK